MITGEYAKALELAYIEKQMAEEHAQKIQNHELNVAAFNRRIVGQEIAKKNAEKRFPKVLETVEKNIERNVQYGNTTIKYVITNNDMEDAMLAIMLFQVMTLNGFICTFTNEGKLEIGWA